MFNNLKNNAIGLFNHGESNGTKASIAFFANQELLNMTTGGGSLIYTA
jgi:hypothetical protein